MTVAVFNCDKVISTERKTSPLLYGPWYLHRDAKYETYYDFLAHLKMITGNVPAFEENLTVQFGSDAEKALTKAIKANFPSAKHKLCSRHAKDNIKHFLCDKCGIKKQERKEIMRQIFGDNGLIRSDDVEEQIKYFLTCPLVASHTDFVSYFKANHAPAIKTMAYKNINESLWTNNWCESLNNVIKQFTSWKVQTLQNLIKCLKDLTERQYLDLKRAIYGSGNYRLTGQYLKFAKSPEDWFGSTIDERNRHFSKILSATDFNNISERMIRIQCVSRIAKMPGLH